VIEALLACPACAQGATRAASPWLVAALMAVPFLVALAVGLYLRRS
jgi:hypothetical protein